MDNQLSHLCKVIATNIPGTRANVAHQKREMEQRLRSLGYSRSQSTTLASKYFEKLQKDRADVSQ